MDLQLTDDQEELRAGVRSFLRQACPPALVRQAFEAEDDRFGPRSDELWARMVDLDWPALAIPGSCGGMGLGMVELCLVAEELGRAAAPGPFLATATQYAPMVAGAATPVQADAFLRPVAEGRVTGALALAERPGRWEPEAVAATARPDGSAWVLGGTKSWVVGGATADEIAVVARRPGSAGAAGLGVFVVAGPTVTTRPLAVMDPTVSMAEVVLDEVRVEADRVLVEPGDERAAPAITRALQEATACMAAVVNGACRTIFETTLQYTKDRRQYGRPIGSFQALKHRLVDMYTGLERASALSAFAALTIAEDDGRRAVAVAMAKAAAGDNQRLMVEDGLQLHGGIGFTWEHDLHMFLKRAKTADLLFGSGRVHRLAVARLLELVP